MKKEICSIRGCKKIVEGWIGRKGYCREHWKIEKEINKSLERKKGLCKVNGCRNILSHTNKSGFCNMHRYLFK